MNFGMRTKITYHLKYRKLKNKKQTEKHDQNIVVYRVAFVLFLNFTMIILYDPFIPGFRSNALAIFNKYSAKHKKKIE